MILNFDGFRTAQDMKLNLSMILLSSSMTTTNPSHCALKHSASLVIAHLSITRDREASATNAQKISLTASAKDFVKPDQSQNKSALSLKDITGEEGIECKTIFVTLCMESNRGYNLTEARLEEEQGYIEVSRRT